MSLADPGLVGCKRRNRWEQRRETPWRWLRGNSLLAAIGRRNGFDTQVGPLEVYMYNNWLLQFRGGKWNPEWMEDFQDIWSFVRLHYGEALSRTIMVIHENKGDIDVKIVSVERDFDWFARTEQILLDFKESRRIPKNTPKAVRVCAYCPQKQRCDAYDKLKGETHDWGPNYPVP